MMHKRDHTQQKATGFAGYAGNKSIIWNFIHVQEYPDILEVFMFMLKTIFLQLCAKTA